jgi:uncharacterized membrane protein SpoIIM required for sporulation
MGAGAPPVTPLQFEETYRADWAELETGLTRLGGRAGRGGDERPIPAARLASIYRRTCEHLALARARSYPSHLIDRLERVTAEAHQVIYQHRAFTWSRLVDLVARDFPAAVRAHRAYVALSTLAFLVPALAIGAVVYRQPELILSIVSSEMAVEFDEMYARSADAIGRTRSASTDWMMFGFYIRNNIGVAFQCFASGVFAGIGSLFFLAYNGAFSGAIAGYLTERGLSSTFYPFIATHSAFELTAIILAGAAGLRMGHAWLMPGRLPRRQSLVSATRQSVVLLYGATAMLVAAAAVEAFWSSAAWLPPLVKYVAAACCWTGVFAYFARQGRHAD